MGAGDRVVEGQPRGFVVERVFDAPRERVFDAFTRAEDLKQWWGPKAASVTMAEFDARPGGKIFLCQRGPDGTMVYIAGSVREIERPSRLVFGIYFADADRRRVAPPAMSSLPPTWDEELVTLVVFAAEGERTRVTIHTLSGFTPEWAEKARYGWAEAFDQLEGVLSSLGRSA